EKNRVEQHRCRYQVRLFGRGERDHRSAGRVTDAEHTSEPKRVHEGGQVGLEVGPTVATGLVAVAVAAGVQAVAMEARLQPAYVWRPHVRMEAGGVQQQGGRAVAAPIDVMQPDAVCRDEAVVERSIAQTVTPARSRSLKPPASAVI